ncbi:MAG: hypothetical protein EHM28_15410, partial [Spirochaetaceae bacterium]
PEFSGKLSTALETARVLSCEKRGEWACDCTACKQTKQLLNPYTVMTGWRGFITDIRACASTLSRVRSTAAQYLFVRSVRKLSRRFDTHLFAADETKRKGIQEIILRMEELLNQISPEQELPEDQKLSKITDEILSCAEKLESYISRDNIPVAQVRNILQWCHETAVTEKKVVIMENAAGMLDSSRNALLKILEEPPRNVHFILTAPRPDEIIPTIRSRLRNYRFMDRNHGQTTEILSRVFKEEGSGYPSLKNYFLAWEDINTELTATLAARFLDRVMSSKPVILQNEIPELFDRACPPGLVRYFLEILLEQFRDIADRQHGEETLSRIERWTRILNTRNREYNALNISTELFLEHLYLDMREAV